MCHVQPVGHHPHREQPEKGPGSDSTQGDADAKHTT